MLKALFIFAVTLLPVFTGISNSHANSRLTHERFVHYTLEEKKALIVQTMKLMVEIESRYKYEVRKNGFNQTRLKKYTQLLEKLQSFILSSAYAQDSSDWSRNITNFSALIKEPNKCLYGGWISQLNSAGLCTHPMNLPKASSERKAYKSGCREPSQISCNPIIFGYKSKKPNDAQSSVFCVAAGPSNDNAHNASLKCMEKALKDPNEGDSKDKRLSDMAKEIEANSAMAKNLHDFISRACVCPTGPVNLDAKYQDYIRPHRTCYALMKMVSNATNSCTTPAVDGNNLAMIQQLFGKLTAPIDQEASSYDTFFSGALNEISDSSEYKNFCNIAAADNSGSQSQNNSGGASGGVTSGASGGTSVISDGTSSVTTGGSTAGATSGSTAGATSGSTAGATSGSTAGATSGSTAGATSGSTAGATSGSTAGATSGSTAGATSGSTAGATSGSTAGAGPGDLVVSSTGKPATGTQPPRTGGSETIPSTSAGSDNSTVAKPTTKTPGPAGSGDPDSKSDTAADSTTEFKLDVSLEDEDEDKAILKADTTPAELGAGVTIVWFAKYSGKAVIPDPKVLTSATVTPAVGTSPPASGSEIAKPAVAAPAAAATPTVAPTTAALPKVTDAKDAQGEKRYSSLTGRDVELTKFEEEFEMCAKLVRGDTVVSNTDCENIKKKRPTVIIKPAADTNLSISLSITENKKDDKVTINAKIEPDSKLPAGVTIFWFNRTTEKEPTPSTKVAGAAGDDVVVPDTEEKPAEPANESPAKDTPKSIDDLKKEPGVEEIGKESGLSLVVEKKKVDFKVCAVLIKDGKQQGTDACVVVPKKVAKPVIRNASPGNNNPMQPPFQPSRGGGDVYLRGVR